MPSLPAYTIYAFGITSFVAGLQTLFTPHASLESFSLPTAALPAMTGNGLAATAMGIYYTLAAAQENKTFFLLTVPMRLLTTVMFANFAGPWKLAAVWEGGGALLTLLAIGIERYWKDEKRRA